MWPWTVGHCLLSSSSSLECPTHWEFFSCPLWFWLIPHGWSERTDSDYFHIAQLSLQKLTLGEKSIDWHMTDLNNDYRAGWGKGHLLEASYSLLSHQMILQRFWSQSLSPNAGIVWGHTVWAQEKWTTEVFLSSSWAHFAMAGDLFCEKEKQKSIEVRRANSPQGSRKSSRMALK